MIEGLLASLGLAKESEKFKEDHHDVDVDEESSDHVVVEAQLVRTASCNKLDVKHKIEAVKNDEQGRD